MSRTRQIEKVIELAQEVKELIHDGIYSNFISPDCTLLIGFCTVYDPQFFQVKISSISHRGDKEEAYIYKDSSPEWKRLEEILLPLVEPAKKRYGDQLRSRLKKASETNLLKLNHLLEITKDDK